MILASTALALSGALFVMGMQSAHISALTVALNFSLCILVLMILAGAAYLLHRHFIQSARG